MYKWLKEYFTAFGKDFPFSEVKDLNEYEIIRIIQDCVKNNLIYTADNKTPVDAIITKIDLAVGNATDINFTLDKSIVYVTLEDLETNLQKHNSNADTHELAFNKHNADIPQ